MRGCWRRFPEWCPDRKRGPDGPFFFHINTFRVKGLQAFGKARRNEPPGRLSIVCEPHLGYTYRLLMARPEALPARGFGPSQEGSMASKPKTLTEAEIVKMPKSEYMNAAQLKFFRERLSSCKAAAGERGRHDRAPARAVLRAGSGRPRDAGGGARPGASHPRSRAQAPQEDRPGAHPNRGRQLRLLRGDRRADRHPATARADAPFPSNGDIKLDQNNLLPGHGKGGIEKEETEEEKA